MLWAALRLAGAEQFVKRIGGLEATIAEGGRSLSGGEKRRLGIARVLTGDPQILVLDEVTTGLDPQTKAEIRATIDRLVQDIVTLEITHDPIDEGALGENAFFVVAAG